MLLGLVGVRLRLGRVVGWEGAVLEVVRVVVVAPAGVLEEVEEEEIVVAEGEAVVVVVVEGAAVEGVVEVVVEQ